MFIVVLQVMLKSIMKRTKNTLANLTAKKSLQKQKKSS